VFTVPHELNVLALENPRLFYDLLFTASAQTLLEIAIDRKHLGAEIGVISILHTWGQNLLLHPHIHCAVPAGGLSPDHRRWIRPRYPCLLTCKSPQPRFSRQVPRWPQTSTPPQEALLQRSCRRSGGSAAVPSIVGVHIHKKAAQLSTISSIALARQSNPADAVTDVAAALGYLRNCTPKKCGVIGYCFGGTMAWLSATRLNPDAAVGYYGGHIANFAQENPRCPVMLHFGTLDKHIPKEDVERVHRAHPDVEIFWYEADHGFNCDDRASYNATAAKQAWDRSLEFLNKHLCK